MNPLTSRLPVAARLLLGLLFAVFGANGFLQLIPNPAPVGAQAELMAGFAAVGYFFPLLKLTELVVGLALLSNRFVALALVVLAPITVNIVAYNALTPAALGLPLLVLALHLGLAWHHSAAYRPLLAARARVAGDADVASAPAANAA